MPYHVDNFFAAVSVLAGHGHIKQRLIAAFEDNLESIEEKDLPVPVKQTFADLKHMMHRVAPLNGEGPICASVRKMSVDEADQCARLVVDIYGDMIRHGDDGQESLPLQIDDRSTRPPFLVKSG
ncbi:MAG: hypothetical protein ACE5OQ_00665 [Woeseia sp.]